MTRTKKISSSPNPSVVQAAWEAFYKESKVEDLDALNAEGWKTIDQIAEETGRTRNTIDSATRKPFRFERRSARVQAMNGAIRRMTLIRPKLKG